MTPEERAVINAAISLSREIRGRHTAPRSTALAEFAGIVNRLVYSCPQCNTETHRCGGCGAEVGHGEYTCSDCEEPPRLNVAASTAGVNDPIGVGDPNEKGSRDHLWGEPESECTAGASPEPEIHTASTVATAELSAALERQRDERPMHWGDDNRTACGKFSGMVYQYTGDSRRVTCPECLESGNNQLIWHPRTMKDARKGDQIRPAGSDMPNGTAVTDRYWPPTPDASDRGTWHVVPGASGKHWDDHVVQPGEVWLCLDGGAPQPLNPDFPIEILLTRAEIAKIELLGWDNRESLTTE